MTVEGENGPLALADARASVRLFQPLRLRDSGGGIFRGPTDSVVVGDILACDAQGDRHSGVSTWARIDEKARDARSPWSAGPA